MRLKKILQNSVMETFFYIIIAIVGLLKVKYIIQGLGSEMNGYYQFINNIVAYVVLAEAGISAAILYKMYKPVANKDYKKISQLFNGSKSILKGIGLLFIAIAVVLLPFIYFTIRNFRTFLLVGFCFMMLIFAVAIPYIFGTRSYTSLLTADQKRFTYGLVFNISRLFTDIFIIIFVLYTNSLISIVIINLIFKILETFIITSYCKKKYKYLDKNEKPDKSAKKMSGYMLYHQIGYIVFNNVDQILLMLFSGPVMVSIYSSYNYIATFIKEIMDKNNQMINNIFGNSFAKKEKNTYEYFKGYMSIFSALSIIIAICFILGGRSFINLWIGNSKYLLDYYAVCAFAGIIVLTIVLSSINTIIHTNGLFKESKFYPIFESVLNIILSVILINFLGITGVLFATIISNFIGMFVRVKLINEKVFKDISFKVLIYKPVLTICIFLIICLLLKNIESFYFASSLNFISWFLIMGITFVCVSILVLVLYYIFDKNMKENINMVFRRGKYAKSR